MKKLLLFAGGALGALALGVVSVNGQGGTGSVMKEARVTQVVKDVKLVSGQTEPRPATLTDTVRGDTAVRTGPESRAELTFGDLTIARLGANTIFSFNQGSRTVDLGNGAILLRVPKGSGGAKVQTAAVTAAITGTTVIVEYHPKSYAKYLVLEGSMRIYLKGTLGESVLMGPGQMMILNPNAKRLSEPVDFDLARLWKTSLFIQGFRPLQSEPLMAEVKQTQLERKTAGELIDTNLVIFGRGTLVTLTDPQSTDVVDRKTAAVTLPTPTPTATPKATPTVTPAPTPAKFGTPGVITSFTPYPIDNGTVIQTDPSITRAGVIDFGKIYRSSAQDGPFSAWAFGATSPFDTTSGIDTRVFPSMAVFKFANLQLVGNPTVLTANGGVGNLGLVSVGPISSAPAGDTNFTLPNRGNLLIATQSGSIALSGINFSNLNDLTLYARGAGSNLTVTGGLTNLGQASFLAEGDVQTNSTGSVGNYVAFAGNDYLAGTGPLTVLIRIDITAQRDLNFASRQFAPQGPIPILVNGLLLNAGRAANLDVSVNNSIFNLVGGPGVVVNGGSAINVTGNPGVTTLSLFPSASFTAGSGGIQAPGILFQHMVPPPGAVRGGITMTSGGAINVNGIIDGILIQAAGQVNAAGVLNAQSVTAGSNVTAGDVQVLTLNAPGVLAATGAGIHPFLFAGPGAQHQFTIGSIVSPNGIDFSGDYYVSNGAASPQPGGKLSINATTLTLDGAANFSGSSGVPANSAGGSGGQFTINTTGAITLNAPIQATTGSNAAGVAFGGTGGTVSLTATAGAVNVNSSILVSSNDPDTTPAPFRRSAAGGTLSLTSGLTTGNAITLGPAAQLFSLLNAGAPGPGGQITISSAGGNIIDNGATIEADRGTITIQHSPLPPTATAQITLDGGAITSETLFASSGGDLTIGATTPVNLTAVTLTLSAQRNLSWSGGTLVATASASSGNAILTAINNLTISGPADIQRFNGGRTDGLQITLFAAQNLQVNQSLNLLTDGSGLASGGNILVQSGAAMTFGGVATFQTGPNSGNQGGGSQITIQAGGAITAADLFATVQIGAGRTLINDGIILLSGGSYTATLGDGGLTLRVLNSAAKITGNGGRITLTLGSLTTGPTGALNLLVNNSNGGQIQTGGSISASFTGGVTANSINVQVDNRLNGFIGNGGNLNFTVGGTLATASDANFTILNSQSGTLGGTINSPVALTLTLANTNIGKNLNAFIDNSDGQIGPSGNEGTVTIQINGTLTVGGRIDVFGNLTATGAITAGELSATNVNAPSVAVGGGGITRFSFPNELTVNPLHTITTNTLTSTGGINFNGPDMDTPPGFGPFDGGQLTINVPSLTIGPTAADNIQGPVAFNGGNSSTNPIPAGNGGIFNVNATGAITVSSPIQATTGLQADASEASGAGGTVNLNSTGGTISVNSAITVSSADAATAPPSPRRKSRSGGNINLKSDAPTGVAINVSNTGQLLSLLDVAAPGPGGKITILATGTNSRIQITGKSPADTIRADKAGGFVDVRHTGAAGTITMTEANISADIVKVGALGANGSLTIGGGRIDANTVLKLYATGANGSVIFMSNVVLNLNSTNMLDRIIIAGNSVTVNNNVVVAIGSPAGLSRTADIYVPNLAAANYSNFNGGNNTTSGMFIIDGTQGSPVSGADTHFAAPPAFGPPGGP